MYKFVEIIVFYGADPWQYDNSIDFANKSVLFSANNLIYGIAHVRVILELIDIQIERCTFCGSRL